jgi:hypothetical protein
MQTRTLTFRLLGESETSVHEGTCLISRQFLVRVSVTGRVLAHIESEDVERVSLQWNSVILAVQLSAIWP